MPMPIVGPLWRAYRRATLDPAAGPVQRRETRRAFYAGAMAIHALVEEMAAPDYSDEAARNILVSIKAELDAFTAEMAGHAVAESLASAMAPTAEGEGS